MKELFRNPVIRIGDARGTRDVMTVAATAVLRGTVGEMKNPYKIYLSSVTCMNLVKLDAELKKIVVPEGTKANYMLILAGKIVDHTTMEYLHNFQDRAIEGGHTCVLVGMEHFRGLSDHAMAYRVSQTPGTSRPSHEEARLCVEASGRRCDWVLKPSKLIPVHMSRPIDGRKKMMRISYYDSLEVQFAGP